MRVCSGYLGSIPNELKGLGDDLETTWDAEEKAEKKLHELCPKARIVFYPMFESKMLNLDYGFSVWENQKCLTRTHRDRLSALEEAICMLQGE